MKLTCCKIVGKAVLRIPLMLMVFCLGLEEVSSQQVLYSDTSSMLSPYMRRWNAVKYGDTARMLSAYMRKIDGVKTVEMQNILTQYVKKSNAVKYRDTSEMLLPYVKQVLAVKYVDTAEMLKTYLRTIQADRRYASVQRLSDYLRLSGGNMTGTLYGTEARFSGDVFTKKLVVSVNGWSDDVFDKSYPLRSLKEIENFIQKNHHLPDVPSAKEVLDKGVSVGENQALLLRKIEELTLHMIEQQKRIEVLENEHRKKQRNK